MRFFCDLTKYMNNHTKNDKEKVGMNGSRHSVGYMEYFTDKVLFQIVMIRVCYHATAWLYGGICPVPSELLLHRKHHTN